MKVDSDYFESAAHLFSQKNPHFWKILRKYSFEYDEFFYIYETIVDNIANFSPTSMTTLAYCIDLYITTSIHEVSTTILKSMSDLGSRIKHSDIRADMIHNTIVQKIGDNFKYMENLHMRIKCPYVRDKYNTYENTDIYYQLLDYNNSVKRGHFYVMLYVFDLTLRMQKIKSEIIKYELARDCRPSGTILDVLIDENFLYYRELNKEFKIYNKIMREFNYYGTRVGEVKELGNILCPNNNHILYFYYKQVKIP